jgi:ABC-type transporter lipoprotein component MlaA
VDPVVATPAAEDDQVMLPESVPDPLEPFNRIMWAVNNGLMIGVLEPTSRVYRRAVPKPLRWGIRNFARNLTYPGRLINHLLQARWHGARDETYRFLGNSTVGVGGLLDVGTRWGIPASDADFGQTFGHWGWKPGCYLMLPIIGPGNERDLLGLGADTAANPLVYLAPYSFDAGRPLTYLGPYAYFSGAARYNEASDTVEDHLRFIRSEMDPYSIVQYAWTFARSANGAAPAKTAEVEPAYHDTLESVFFAPEDPVFPTRGVTRSVDIPSTGRALRFTYWLQPGGSDVVYILPGLGAHRLARPSLALAELVYAKGYSVVSVSSAYHAEFMENASTAAMPSYLPVDSNDVHAALTAIDHRLEARHPGRLGSRVLLGYSMGAFQALHIAAGDPPSKAPKALLHFQRTVAISTPVRLLYGVSRLDAFYRAVLEWPAAERTARIEGTFRKVAQLSKRSLTPETPMPFSGTEARFLIGLMFRFTLRDIIFSSQRRTPTGVLLQPVRNLRRDPLYQEILGYSYRDYFEKLAVPYWRSKGLAEPVGATVESAGDLRVYEAGLRANPSIRVLVSENDFLLEDTDIAWLRTTFGSGRLKVFERGGHMGNLSHPSVQREILEALSGPGSTQAHPDADVQEQGEGVTEAAARAGLPDRP